VIAGPSRTKFLAELLVRRWVKMGIFPSLEIRNKNQIFLENLTLAAKF